MSITASWSGGGGDFALLVHGGAGDVPIERRRTHSEGCARVVDAVRPMLERGGSALDAVQRAVELLEDDPSYNAGTGASLDEDGELRLDASIMDGATLGFGGVAGLPPFRHPIAVAREVLRDGRHVLYAGDGAARFARARGFEPAEPDAMITAAARERLAATKRGESGNWAGNTVGAVARDVHGHVAAATSTGGVVGKRAGRVGDSPIPGAGTYADDGAGAASGTGEGEGFLRVVACARATLFLEAGASPQDAAKRVVELLLARANARGGIILVDRQGRLGLARSTATMSWAAAWSGVETVAGY